MTNSKLRHIRLSAVACGLAASACTEVLIKSETDGPVDPEHEYSIAIDGTGVARLGLNDSTLILGDMARGSRVRIGDIPQHCVVRGGESRVVAREVRFRVTCLDLSRVGEVELPAANEWNDAGVVLSSQTGTWDSRLGGAISPAAAIKHHGRYILYYIGADGDRYDGGPANRALGAAVSTDGIHFRRWEGNPVITFQPSAPAGENVEEEGVFSAAVTRSQNGDVVALFGGMEATTRTAVNSSAVIATSRDGLEFEVGAPVIVSSDPSTIGSDEIFPTGILQITPDLWVVYYITTGAGEYSWSWAVAYGDTPRAYEHHALALHSLNERYPGGGDPIRLSTTRFLMPTTRGFGGDSLIVDFRVTEVYQPDDLSRVLSTQVFSDMQHLTLLLDEERSTWFLYYLDGSGENIRVKTAPMRRRH